MSTCNHCKFWERVSHAPDVGSCFKLVQLGGQFVLVTGQTGAIYRDGHLITPADFGCNRFSQAEQGKGER